jgi:hypothetical protein
MVNLHIRIAVHKVLTSAKIPHQDKLESFWGRRMMDQEVDFMPKLRILHG